MDSSFLHKALAKAVDDGVLPGGAFVVGKDSLVERGSVGVSDISDPSKTFTTTTICRLMSMTKALISAGVMACVDDITLTVHDPVSKYIPEFANTPLIVKEENAKGYERSTQTDFAVPEGFVAVKPKNPILVRDLMLHSGGQVPNFVLDLKPFTAEEQAAIKITADLGVVGVVNEGQRGITLEQHVKLLAKAPIAFEPGTSVVYATGLDIAGRVIEVASGKPLQQFLRERIFEPCGMVDTGFSVPQDKLHRFAGMQGSFDAVAKGKMIPLPYEDFPFPGGQPLPMSSVYVEDGKALPWPNGSGGAVSTAEDYFKFTQMLLHDGVSNGKHVLSRSSARILQSPSDLPLRTLPLLSMRGFMMAFGGAVTPSAGVNSSSAPGVYTWGGFYISIFIVDRLNNASGVIMSQGLLDTDKISRVFSLFTDGLARAYADV